MSKVRCPLCSNLNPPEAEECAFCGARLKPIAPPSGGSSEQAGESQPENENDWLRSLQDEGSEQAGAAGEQPEPGEDVPDWLSRIRSRAQDETPGEDEQPDWMRDLTEGESSIEGEPFNPSEAAGAPSEEDWFSRLETPAGDQPAEQPASAEPAADLPDWLRDMSGAPEDTGAEQAAAPFGGLSSADEDFSWLGGEPQAETPGQAEDSSSSFGLTGFLSGLESESTAPESPREEQGAEPASEEVPEWLGSFSPGETPSAEPASEVPDWLSTLGENAGAEEQPAAEEPSAEEQEQEPVFSPPAAAAPEPEELPSWFMDEEETPAVPSEPAAVGEEEAPAPAESMPDWMAELQPPPLEQPVPPDVPEPSAEVSPESIPLFADESAAFGQEDAVPPPEAIEPELPKEEVPDWLRNFEEQTPSSASVPPLFETESEVVPEAAAEGDQPFAVDLPDWLSEDVQREPGQEAAPESEPVAEELAKAELPDWVKEMRPIESIIPTEAQIPEGEQVAEKAGPLAGLAGILPAEEMTTHYRRPPVYSAKLRVTEKQRGQAGQFESIIEQESQPLLIPARRRREQGGWLRVLIAMLLIFVLLLPPLVGMQPLAIPTLSPDETKRMFDQIEGGFSTGAPVLLAVDFDPGMWGEMRLAAQPVVDHMMAKNTRIVVVSTRANGAALAEQLLSETVARHTGYNLIEMTENLGYLPGDMISLLEFAQQPVFAAPANLAGELAWEHPALQGITGLQDFAGVVVLTDTAETGRAWVEQVQPQMGDVPLLMVTSAQAAPMMTPFIESGQVDGMTSGLLGGVLYSQWAQQQGAAFQYLASYQVGVLLALAMALGGGLISGAIALINRGKEEE